MKIFAPAYYKDFKCIADKCKHNCCIGWEIDIDGDTLAFYKTTPEISEKIDFNGEPNFILGENDRCPFLRKDNLCHIIKTYGEENLCQICSDHPRFRSFFDTREEIGLGLACEAAARLILDNDFSVIQIGTDSEEVFENSEETGFFKERDEIFKSDFGELAPSLPDIPLYKVADFLYSLERLDSKWDDRLNRIKNDPKSIKETIIEDREKTKRLLDYFIFRHYHEYSLSFCLMCTYIIFALGGDIYDTARMFSGEIEYSDENTEKLFEFCK